MDILIPAFLESSVIAETLSRLRNQTRGGPFNTRLVVLASDSETYAAASEADERRIVPRAGKADAINRGVADSVADYILLTDANCQIEPNDWPLKLRDSLGAADLVSAQKSENESRDALFWLFERLIKERGRNAETLSVVGEFLAFPRELFVSAPSDSVSEDLWIAISFASRALSVKLNPEITVRESVGTASEQWERRVRIASGQLFEITRNFSPLLRSRAGRNYLMHKGYRLTVGPAAYWTGVSLMMFSPRKVARVAVLAGHLLAIMNYRGMLHLPLPLGRLSAPVAMQAVPGFAVVRLLRSKAAAEGSSSPGWTKAQR